MLRRTPSDGSPAAVAVAQAALLALPAIVGLLGLATLVVGAVLVAEAVVAPWVGAAMLAVGALGGAVGLFLLLSPAARIRLLVARPCGRWHVPTSLAALEEVLRDGAARGVVVVGRGWGFWTAHRAARGAGAGANALVVATHRLVGVVTTKADRDAGRITFLAGTTIRHAVRVLARRGLTFYSAPSIQDISLGGWFGASCHGNAGHAGKPSSHAVADKGLRLYDVQRRAWLDESYADARRLLDAEAATGRSTARYVLGAVSFDLGKMQDASKRLQKELLVIRRSGATAPTATTATDAMARWSRPEWPLRLVFLGSARPGYALGLIYKPFGGTDAEWETAMHTHCCVRKRHEDPHDCSAACMSMQLDGFSTVCCGWYERGKEAYNGVLQWADANAFTPDYRFGLLALGLVHLWGVRNCEFVFRFPEPVGDAPTVADQLQRLTDDLIDFFQNPRHYGRAEIRTGSAYNPNVAPAARNARKVVFVDVGARDVAVNALPARLARHVGCGGRIALHTGKYQSRALVDAIQAEPALILVTPAVVYYDGASCVV